MGRQYDSSYNQYDSPYYKYNSQYDTYSSQRQSPRKIYSPPEPVSYFGRKGKDSSIYSEGIPNGRPGLNLAESFQTGESEAQLSTARWLDYRQKVAKKIQFPVSYQQQEPDDIITMDNIYKFVSPPRGPDVFSVNVESALNFGNRY